MPIHPFQSRHMHVCRGIYVTLLQLRSEKAPPSSHCLKDQQTFVGASKSRTTTITSGRLRSNLRYASPLTTLNSLVTFGRRQNWTTSQTCYCLFISHRVRHFSEASYYIVSSKLSSKLNIKFIAGIILYVQLEPCTKGLVFLVVVILKLNIPCTVLNWKLNFRGSFRKRTPGNVLGECAPSVLYSIFAQEHRILVLIFIFSDCSSG